MKMGQGVPKCRHIKFRRLGITQKKTYNIQNTAKVWNQEYYKTFDQTKWWMNRRCMDVTSGKYMLHTELRSTMMFTSLHILRWVNLQIYVTLPKWTECPAWPHAVYLLSLLHSFNLQHLPVKKTETKFLWWQPMTKTYFWFYSYCEV